MTGRWAPTPSVFFKALGRAYGIKVEDVRNADVRVGPAPMPARTPALQGE